MKFGNPGKRIICYANNGTRSLRFPRRAGTHAVRQPMAQIGIVFAHEKPTLATPVAAKARPPFIGGRAALLRLHPNGVIHASANRGRGEGRYSCHHQGPVLVGTNHPCYLGYGVGFGSPQKPNPALNLAPSGRWTALKRRRLALR